MRKVTNEDEFRAAMNECAALAKRDASIIIRKLALDAYGSVVQLTAKDYGYARNNWGVAVDSPAPDGSLTDPGKNKYEDPKPPPLIKKAKYNSKIILFNNTAYIKFLEEGTPDMEAQPMVKPTQQKLYKQAEELYKALNKKKYDI